MLIPDEKVEEVRAATDIVDVISDYVRLKKRGTSFIGLCPFHSEKTPSFNVTPSMGIYKCFGCGEGGDVFNFLMRSENLGFTEVVRMLAERAGIELPAGGASAAQANETESIYNALKLAAAYYHSQMTETDRGRERALAYFADRGFKPETIRRFGLGYAPAGWENLLRYARSEHISTEVLEKAGLILPGKDGGHYDRFRDRAMFPIFSHVGKVVGFGGRVLDAESDQPKYINSPETKVYRKSEILYGLYQSRHEMRGRNEAVLVEGYTDVISLHQAGVQNVVASSGTALTVAQIKAISRYCQTIVLVYDADSAGAAAALRGIDLILSRGLSPYLVSLPEGTDPDSFVRDEGGEAFRKYLEKHRSDFIQFKYGQARQNDPGTPESDAQLMQSVLDSILQIPSALSQEAYIRRAADVLGVPDSVLHREAESRRRRAPSKIRDAPPPPPDVPIKDARRTEAPPEEQPAAPEPLPEEKLLIRLMIEHGSAMARHVLGVLSVEDFTNGVSRDVVGHIIELFHRDELKPAPFIDGKFGEEVGRLVTEVFTQAHEASLNWERKRNIPVPRLFDDAFEAATSAMQQLRLDRIDEAVRAYQKELFQAQQESRDVSNLLLELQELHRMKRQVMDKVFTSPDAQ